MRISPTNNKIRGFIKRFAFCFVLWFLISVEECKTGSGGEARKLPTYYRPTPNTWEYVYEHMSGIVVFSLFAGLVSAVMLTPFFKDE